MPSASSKYPHSPQTRGIKKVFWQGAELYRAEAANAETLEKYGHGTPDDWLEHNVYSRLTWHGAGLMLVIDWILFGLGVGTTVWAVQMVWIPLLAAGVINGIGHYWGYHPFSSGRCGAAMSSHGASRSAARKAAQQPPYLCDVGQAVEQMV